MKNEKLRDVNSKWDMLADIIKTIEKSRYCNGLTVVFQYIEKRQRVPILIIRRRRQFGISLSD
jgi:hypothetical protein